MKFIYVILSATRTVPARLIRIYTGATYSHSSICLREDLQGMCSFARKRISNPLDGGFVIESPMTLSMGKDIFVKVKVFRIPVNDEDYARASEFITAIKNDSEGYIYNILSILTATFGHYSNVYKSFICTNFVIKVLEISGVLPAEMKKSTEIYTPSDIEEIFNDCVYYEGDLRKYPPIKNIEYVNELYFSHIGVLSETKETFRTFKRFIKRYALSRGLKK